MSKKIIVFASGNGSNFENIVKQSHKYNYEVILLFCDRKNAKVIQKAKALSIPFEYLSIIKEKENFHYKLLDILNKYNPDLIVLAGYMKLLDEVITRKWKGKIINVHPSLLPKYPGAHAIEQGIKNNDKEYGMTIHYVDENMDTGKIIFQKQWISNDKTFQEIRNQITVLEHKYYPVIIKKVLCNTKSV